MNINYSLIINIFKYNLVRIRLLNCFVTETKPGYPKQEHHRRNSITYLKKTQICNMFRCLTAVTSSLNTPLRRAESKQRLQQLHKYLLLSRELYEHPWRFVGSSVFCASSSVTVFTHCYDLHSTVGVSLFTVGRTDCLFSVRPHLLKSNCFSAPVSVIVIVMASKTTGCVPVSQNDHCFVCVCFFLMKLDESAFMFCHISLNTN